MREYEIKVKGKTLPLDLMREYEIKVKGKTLPLIFISLAKANFFKRYLIGDMKYAESDIEVRRRVDEGTGGECLE